MDFHQLRIFLEVVKQKSFTRAAQHLFLSQPTVSMHIKKLEREIDAPLFIRGADGLKLSDAGETLFSYAQQLMNIKSEALATLKDEERALRGHLEIAASSVPGAYILPALLRSFLQTHPEITFSLVLRDTEHILQMVEDYTYDFAFTGEAVFQRHLEQLSIAEDELILIASPDVYVPVDSETKSGRPKILLSTCAQFPFLLREPGSATRMVFEEALKKHHPGNGLLNVIGFIESQEAIKEAVKAGVGMTVISKKAVSDDIETGLLKGYELADLPLKRNFYMVFRKDSVFPALSKSFLQYASQYFQPSKAI